MKTTLFLSLLLFAMQITAQPKVIAHRGFWKADGSAQNSIASLIKADSIDSYGCEFDVWLAADGELIVNHDPVYKLHPIEKTKSKKLTALKLKNDEPMPTLRQYLTAAIPLKTKLVLELKKHQKEKRETLAVKKIIAMVDELGLADRMEYITFSLHATKEFIRLAPEGTPVYYLNGELSPQELKALGCAGPDYHQSVFRKNPDWINQSHALGMKVNVWTVNKEEDMDEFISQGVDFITTDEPVLLQEKLKR